MKQTILIVDDEAPIRELLQAYFSKHGYAIVTAGSAADAIQAVNGGTAFDLVILDVVLPDADGLELLGKLRKIRSDLLIIIMTGIGFDDSLLQEAKKKGASGYVSKTLPLDQLLKEVQNALSLK